MQLTVLCLVDAYLAGKILVWLGSKKKKKRGKSVIFTNSISLKSFFFTRAISEIPTFINIMCVCIHCDQKSGKCQRVSGGQFRPSEHQQRSLFHPFYWPSLCLSLLLPSHSLHLSFPFFFSHTLRPGGWRGFGCTCRVAESLLKESMCFEMSLESQASLCLSMSCSLSFPLP